MTIYTKDYPKSAAAVKDYTQDWTAWLGTRAYALRFAQRGVSQQDFFEKSRVQRRG